MFEVHVSRNGCSERPAYVAKREEGQNAYIEGRDGEIILEITQPSQAPFHQWEFAQLVAELLNDHNENHVCNARAQRVRAQHLLLLVRQNRIRDNETIEALSLAIEEAGVEFTRAEIAEFVGVPF